MQKWGEMRWHSLNYHLKTTYGEKLYKLSLNAGLSCPNRDGTLGTKGCIFCSLGGSGDFAASSLLSITDQIEEAKKKVEGKYNGHHYIAYFQAYTNTYAPIETLRRIYMEAANHEDVRILSIATRPDCLSEEILALLAEVSRKKPVWIELGLQTIHPQSASFIRRGYDYPVFEKAVRSLHALQIPVITHVILGLPGESDKDMYATIEALNALPISGIKLHLLHVLKGTDLADYYVTHPFPLPSQAEYEVLIGECIMRLRPDIVVHRLTGDGPKSILIAPLWTGNKKAVLNGIQHYFKANDIWQGKKYNPKEDPCLNH